MGFHVPPEVVSHIVATLQEDQKQAAGKDSANQTALESQLTGIRNRMDAAYADKLDGKIPEDFWERKMSDWRMDEQQVEMAILGLSGAETVDFALNAKQTLELANKAYLRYVSHDFAENFGAFEN